jgi:hypothetical protein
MTADRHKVRWMGTLDSWADIVALYNGLETVAFWEADNTLEWRPMTVGSACRSAVGSAGGLTAQSKYCHPN